MDYTTLSRFGEANRKRIATNLLKLKQSLKKKIPQKTLNETLLLATWNVRDFDSNKFGHGPRLSESFYYIAQVISAYDVVALQEVNEDMKALKRVFKILGGRWDYIITDMTEGRSGNSERMCFIYDTNKVRFKKIAGELVLTQSSLIGDRQFARTPFKVAFQSGWFKFSLCTVHLYFGSDRGEKLERRIGEIRQVGKSLAKIAKREESNIIVLGDFNIVSPEHETMKALTDSGFVVPEGLKLKTNRKKDKYYDQIAFMLKRNELQMGDSSPNSGVFDFYTSVFKDNDYNDYYKLAKNKRKWYKSGATDEEKDEQKKKYFNNTWKTFQMSDHFPLWVELKINFSEKYLKAITRKTK